MVMVQCLQSSDLNIAGHKAVSASAADLCLVLLFKANNLELVSLSAELICYCNIIIPPRSGATLNLLSASTLR